MDNKYSKESLKMKQELKEEILGLLQDKLHKGMFYLHGIELLEGCKFAVYELRKTDNKSYIKKQNAAKKSKK